MDLGNAQDNLRFRMFLGNWLCSVTVSVLLVISGRVVDMVMRLSGQLWHFFLPNLYSSNLSDQSCVTLCLRLRRSLSVYFY